ncbi:MAG: hypothetical protein RL368_389 [Pseudomonadota bacterium]|jgi:hypothetical protein
MKKFSIPQFILLEELITYVKEKADRSISYDVYTKSGDNFSENEIVLVDSTIQVDDNDKEIYPPEAIKNNLQYAYSGDQFQDVVDLAMRQKPTATTLEIINALNYYSEHDDFLDIK